MNSEPLAQLELQKDETSSDNDRFFHHTLYRQIKFIEEAILIVSTVSHLLMLRFMPQAHTINRWTIAVLCLVIYYIITRIDVVDRPKRVRLCMLIMSTTALCCAFVAGQPSMINPLFAVLIARIVLLIDGQAKWVFSVCVYIALCAATLVRFQIWQWKGMPIEPVEGLLFGITTFFTTSLWQGILMALVALLVHSLIKSKQQMVETERLSREVAHLAASLERTRIARDIHDSVGHSLTSLSVQLEVARKLLSRDREKSEAALGEAEQMAKRCLRDVRNSIALMRVDDFDFKEALGTLLDGIESGGAIKVERIVEIPELTSVTAYQVFRVIQESCTNAIRHSGANLLEVSVTPGEQTLTIIVKDNGRGFDAQKQFSSFGLTGIRERVGDLKGNLEISSNGDGTTVSVSVPVVS